MSTPSFLRCFALLRAFSAAALTAGISAASCSVPDFEFPSEYDPGPPAHCTDDAQSDGETGLNCGGECDPCPLGAGCAASRDCAEGECIDGICQEAGCMNHARDGSESDIDCGGSCDKKCATGQDCNLASDCESRVCQEGLCVAPTCTDGVHNGTESDVDCGADCGGCEDRKNCRSSKDCLSSDCIDGVCGPTCPDGYANCDRQVEGECEVNLRGDVDNCGACGQKCALPRATAECQGGACKVKECEAPYADCDGDPENGCEVNTATDSSHCGGCDELCPAVNGDAYCEASECKIACDEGFTDCNGLVGDGCERAVTRDVLNCGGCGIECKPTAGGRPWCRDGECGETVCPAGRGDCNGDPDDSCEVNLAADPENCGTCGSLCTVANGTGKCTATGCAIGTCEPGFADCDGSYENGCETNTATSLSHCGGCGEVCTIAGGAPKCEGGECKVRTCNSGMGDCDGDPDNGCETNVNANQTHCGACAAAGGVNCNTIYANATATCQSGACSFVSCKADYANCNSSLTDGCEANIRTDEAHCGGCGTQCNTIHTTSNLCIDGTCNPVCTSAQYDDCGVPRNGCNIDLWSDASNCLGCNLVCESGASAHVTSNQCSRSGCNPVCSGLWRNCDGDGMNGCEKDVSSDINACGACNTRCLQANASTTACRSGTCVPTCNPGWKACGDPSDGCTTQLGTSSNCGDCGHVCSGARPICSNGSCVVTPDIVVVNSGTGSVSASGSTTPIITVNHALQSPSGNDRMVLVGVVASENALVPVSVTYDGTPMTLFNGVTTENNATARIYYLLDSQLPATTGTRPVVVQMANSASWGMYFANVVELKGVHQSNPFASATSTGLLNNAMDCNGTARGVTTNFSATNSFVYTVMAARNANASPAISPTSATSTMNLRLTSPATMVALAGYLVANSNTTISWNVSNCWSTAGVGVAVRRAGGG
ncbi:MULTISPECIES: hypothetical protein [Sorangium]|uniref:TNFR-Cys domain-containing protein n=1 Tax=Sorangium cellulosum TaxID=56 RepID=A0A4V0NF98_SORCE|nr:MULTISPECIES: hypothetical protein [Sorangium]AUX28922.1 hypothetical protein SOCE836_010070 [Sorangium cellulosum]WCQ88317.1 hypothetical protein NQZ70_00992 [Sorangium sp. Soce836]